MTHLHTPPYHTGPLPALRLSPLPISTGSHFTAHSRFRCRNYRHAGQTARIPTGWNTTRLQWPEPPLVSMAGDNPYGSQRGTKKPSGARGSSQT